MVSMITVNNETNLKLQSNSVSSGSGI